MTTLGPEWSALPAEIHTPRLVLRAWLASDVDDVLAYTRDPEWSRFLRLLPTPYTRADAEAFLERQVGFDPITQPNWAISLDDTVIGGLNLRLHPRHRLAEMGYSVARSHWNRGICTEAASSVVDVAFRTWAQLNRIRAMADVDNTASQRVLSKLGMTKEGVLRQNRIERGTPIDEAWFGILRAEWTGNTAPAPSAPR